MGEIVFLSVHGVRFMNKKSYSIMGSTLNSNVQMLLTIVINGYFVIDQSV